ARLRGLTGDSPAADCAQQAPPARRAAAPGRGTPPRPPAGAASAQARSADAAALRVLRSGAATAPARAACRASRSRGDAPYRW
ncbi:hypothetical protein ABT174_36710, partial [Streptomyces sparsogenes]